MKNNSFILLKEEKERIRKLYEQTTASSSGAFEQPMAFTEKSEDFELETVVDGGDNVAPDSMEITLNIEDLADMIPISEEEDKKRMRKLHKDNSIVKEQSDSTTVPLEVGFEDEGVQVTTPVGTAEVSTECLTCTKKAVGEEYATLAQTIIEDIQTMISGEKDPTEIDEIKYIALATKVLLKVLKDVKNPMTIGSIALKLWGCYDVCSTGVSIETDIDITP